ncbi:MAG: flagellar hook-basal body complex protein FliE [Phycisphaerales bacterium]|nr:flagellar hook-basal body complex protein FliE [Phycisphaerales bacterium]
MADPIGLIQSIGPIDRASGTRPSATPPSGGPAFKDLLVDQIRQVNELQRDAEEATQDVVTGRSDDVIGLMTATEKADTAFRLLLQVRNKVMDAYEEIKQIRV